MPVLHCRCGVERSMMLVVRISRLVLSQRQLIWAMVLREIRYKYAGTIGGVLWSFAHPAVTVLVYWVVFSVGLKVQPLKDVPFIVVYVGAYLPWIFFVETLGNSCSSISSNPHLVKKVAFPTEILPVVQLLVSFVTHAAMMTLYMVLLAVNGIWPSLYNLQFAYYLLALSAFTLGLSWLVASMNVLFKDVGQVLAMVLQVLFWLTPIVWPLEMLPQWGQRLAKLNPLYYIISGYRNSFVTHQPAWTDLAGGLYFWAVAFGMLLLGCYVFSRLKPEFADVI